MIESLGLIFTVLAAVWVRKQDIATFLTEGDSREKIISQVIFPESQFKISIITLLNFMDRFFESGIKFFFSIFMLSLLYVSISFIFSLNFVEAKNLFFRGQMTTEDARTAFLVFIVSMPLTWVLASTHNRHLRSQLVTPANSQNSRRRIRRLNSRITHRFYYIAAAISLTVSAAIVYKSLYLTVFTLIVALGSTAYPLYLSPFFLMKERYFHVAIGTTLGTLGLLLSAFSFASEMMASLDYIFIIGLCLTSATLAVVSLNRSRAVADNRYRDFWRFVPCSRRKLDILASSIGRPSLFVGFHCTRASGAFCAAVSIILVNVAIARTMVPEAVVCAGSIMLACIVFFSGATTLAGAGFFAFGVVLLIGGYMAMSPDLLFSVWASPFLLWILLPLVNSAIDYARWSITRRSMARYVKRADAMHARALFFDLFYAAAGFLIYVFITFFAIKVFDGAASTFGYSLPFDIGEINASIKGGLFHEGIWLLVMAGTMMIPTLIQLTLFFYSGLLFLFSRKYRHGLSKDVRAARSSYEIDAVAWRVSALDIMGRVVLAAFLLLVLIYLGVQLLPLLERAASFAGDQGIVVGNSLLSWLLANL